MTEVDYYIAKTSRPADAALMPPLPPQTKSLHETTLERRLVVELIAKAILVAGKSHLLQLGKLLHGLVAVPHANNGMLIIDDLSCQRLPARQSLLTSCDAPDAAQHKSIA